MKLSDKSLLKDKSLINGQWLSAKNNETISVTNPADGEVVGNVPSLSANEVETAIEASNAAFQQWRKLTAADRSKILRKWFDLMIANADDLAMIMTSEQGKPLKEAKGEILYAASFVEWFAEEAKRTYGDDCKASRSNAAHCSCLGRACKSCRHSCRRFANYYR